MKRSIFVSRHLDEESKLLHYLNNNDWETHHQSLISIEPLPFEINETYDWIFIASANGAKILLQSYTPSEKTKIGVVGTGTAKAVKALGIFPDFIGQGADMDVLGDQLARTIGTDSVLFAGAEGGSEKIRSKIAKNQRSFVALYRTIIKTDISVPSTDVVFLTSPSNATAYLNTHSLNNKTVIAIGYTTAEYLQSKGVDNVLVTRASQIDDAIEVLEQLRS